MKPKILHIGIFNDREPQWSLRKALQDISSEYHEYDWEQNRNNVNQLIIYYSNIVDVIFLQIQSPGIISPSILWSVKSKVQIFNYTGDVRQPLPQWYVDVAPYCTTLFTNNTDVEYLKGLGYDAVYFQTGYNVEFYNADGDKTENAPEIVFMGNHYPNTFPLSQFRYDMVTFLQREYGNRFQVYGRGYPGAIDLMFKQMEEGKAYRSAKIAINCSHFNLKQYSSDRMFRIMGCGCFCLSHRFEDIEKEFLEGIHLRTWENFDELKMLVDTYLDADDLRNDVAISGMNLVTKKYTWDYRMKNDFLQLLNINNGQF